MVSNEQLNDIDNIIEYTRKNDLGNTINKEILITALENLKKKKLISLNTYREKYHHCFDECKCNK